MKQSKAIITVLVVLASFACFGFMSRTPQTPIIHESTMVFKRFDVIDCRVYLEIPTLMRLYIDPRTGSILSSEAVKEFSIERKACKEGLFWHHRNQRCVRPSVRDRDYLCPHDTLCLHRPMPELGPLPLTYVTPLPSETIE